MKVVLELQDQPSNIRKVTVRHDIVIGRGADSNLRLSAPQVSRRHCFVRVSSSEVTVSDLDSCNGTYLNGKRIPSGQRYPVRNGTILAIGPVKFIAHVSSDASSSEPLEIQLQDGRLAGSGGGSALEDELAAADQSSLKLSVEHGGPAADEEEPTADYVSSDVFDDGELSAPKRKSKPRPAPREPETAAGVVEVADVISVVADDDIEFVGDVIDADNLDEAVVDAELIGVTDDDEVEVVEAVEVIDDDEVLAIDESDIIEVSDSEARSSEESDLREFLSGLD